MTDVRASTGRTSFKVFVTVTYTGPDAPPTHKTIRRFGAPAGTTLAAFIQLLKGDVLQRPEGCGAVIVVSYKDGDGDVVEVASELEWQEALQQYAQQGTVSLLVDVTMDGGQPLAAATTEATVRSASSFTASLFPTPSSDYPHDALASSFPAAAEPVEGIVVSTSTAIVVVEAASAAPLLSTEQQQEVRQPSQYTVDDAETPSSDQWVLADVSIMALATPRDSETLRQNLDDTAPTEAANEAADEAHRSTLTDATENAVVVDIDEEPTARVHEATNSDTESDAPTEVDDQSLPASAPTSAPTTTTPNPAPTPVPTYARDGNTNGLLSGWFPFGAFGVRQPTNITNYPIHHAHHRHQRGGMVNRPRQHQDRHATTQTDVRYFRGHTANGLTADVAALMEICPNVTEAQATAALRQYGGKVYRAANALMDAAMVMPRQQ